MLSSFVARPDFPCFPVFIMSLVSFAGMYLPAPHPHNTSKSPLHPTRACKLVHVWLLQAPLLPKARTFQLMKGQMHSLDLPFRPLPTAHRSAYVRLFQAPLLLEALTSKNASPPHNPL